MRTMRGQRPAPTATGYTNSEIESLPIAIDSNDRNGNKEKSFAIISYKINCKLVALVLALHLLIVSSTDTTSTAPVVKSNKNMSTQAISCPKGCVCKLNEEVLYTITTDCTGANLTALPINMNKNTSILILNQNRFSNISDEEISGLPQLKRLWLNDNRLTRVPTHIFITLPKLEALSIANNKIKSIDDFAFKHLSHLVILDLQNNLIDDIKPLAFDGLESLKILEINSNLLKSLPKALTQLHSLRELTIADNQLKYLPNNSFKNNPFLTILEIKGNPLEEVANNAFIDLPFLKKLTLSEVSKLKVLPNFSGTTTLEHLKIDRGELRAIPLSLCQQTPHLKSLIVKSNKIHSMPKLSDCRELKLLDFSYNHIKTLGTEPMFLNQSKLIDLFMGHNLITDIPENAFTGLSSLKVLNLVRNRITSIHTKAFVPLISLKDLNLGDNRFPTLPTEGLQNITEIKVYGNPYLKDFPPVDTFPKVHTLALSYAYHCCAYIGRTHSPTTNPKSLEESIVWLDREDVWNTNMTDVWPGYVNFSTKFEEFANQLWKNFGRDYVIPDNIAEYAEQYFEDYKPNPNQDESLFTSFPVQCLPQPGPFMPCKDLFDWWTLRCGVWIVFLLALLGNGVVVVVLIFGRSKIDVPRFLVCNLAIADFFMGVYLGILAIVDASTLGEFKIYAIRWQTSWGCQVAGFFGVFSSELSVYTLAVITMERNYAITHAMHLNKRLSLKHASYIMSIGWTFAITMAVLPLLGVSDYRKFAVCLPFEVEDSVWSLTYVVFLILINGVAFLVLMGCYLRMYCAIRGSQAWNSNDSRIAKRMALLVFTDFLCWAPIAFFSLTAVSGLHLISLEEAKVFTIFILPLNSCANPFLYAIFTKQFKKDCVLLCKRIEESRVTRGIGRCRNSSNFSNRHTPAVSNSAVERKSTGSDQLPQLVCQCGVRKSKVSIEEIRLITSLKASMGWKQRAIDWFSFGKRNDLQKHNENTNEITKCLKNNERIAGRAASISSDNFSSRSDSWRNANIQMKNIDKINRNTGHHTNTQAIRGRRNSWNVSRKTSQDSSMSCSRQDSSSTSTYTSRISRSSFSSESSSKQTTSTGSSGAGPSGLQKSDLIIKSQLNRQTTEEVKQPKSPPNRTEGAAYLCHNCSRKDTLQQNLSPKNIKFKNKELEEKFNCFYNRLAEASQEDSSDGPEPNIVSTESMAGEKLDLSNNTAETSIQDSVVSQENESQRVRAQPSIEIAAQSPSLGRSLEDFDVLIQSRTPSSQSGKTAIHLSGETFKDQNLLDISLDNITKTHSMTDFGISLDKPKHKTRKVSSENSLKKLSIKNLPSLLRSLSSQTNVNQNKKKTKLYSRKNRSYYRSADNMTQLVSNSCETINHQMSDSILNKRRSTAFELYEIKGFDCSDGEDIDEKTSIRKDIGYELMSDKTISDCRGNGVCNVSVEQKGKTSEDMPLIGAKGVQNGNE